MKFETPPLLTFWSEEVMNSRFVEGSWCNALVEPETSLQR